MEPFRNSDVARIFEAYPDRLRERLLHLRHVIFETASNTDGVETLEETLKWGQPSYLTTQSRSGTTIRLDQFKSDPEQYGMFVHCQTSLIASYRELYGSALRYDGKRCVRFDVKDDPPDEILGHCVAMALTYHLDKRADHLPF